MKNKSLTTHYTLHTTRRRGGFTLTEFLVVIFIVGLMAGLAISSFGSLRSRELLDKSALQMISFIEETRTLSLSAKGGESYGVHFDVDRLVRFPGSPYSINGAQNVSLDLDPGVSITDINLSGGGFEVFFKKLRGATDQSGSITLALVASTTQKKIITVNGVGVVGVE